MAFVARSLSSGSEMKNSKYLKLKAKGASVRSLIPCALDMARANDLGEREIVVAQLLGEFYKIIIAQEIYYR